MADRFESETRLAAAQREIEHAVERLTEADLAVPSDLALVAAQVARLQSALTGPGLSAADHDLLPAVVQTATLSARRAEARAASGEGQRNTHLAHAAARWQAELHQFDTTYQQFLQNTQVALSDDVRAALYTAEAELEEARASGNPSRIRAAELALREAQLRHVQEAAGKGDQAALTALPTLQRSMETLRETAQQLDMVDRAAVTVEDRTALAAAKAAAKPLERPAAGQGAFAPLPDAATLEKLVDAMKASPEAGKLSEEADAALAAEPSSFEQFALPKIPGQDRRRT